MTIKKADETRVRLSLLVRYLPPLAHSLQNQKLFHKLAASSGNGKIVKVVLQEYGVIPELHVEKEAGDALADSSSREDRTVYGAKLAEAIAKLSFMPGFTIHDNTNISHVLWAGTKVKGPTGKMSEQRMLIMECMLTALYLGEIMAKVSNVNHFLQFFCTYELANPLWSRRLIFSLFNLGLKIRENGYLPYVSHLYIQDNETRSSVLALSLLALLITREHKIDHVSAAFESDSFLNIMAVSVYDMAQDDDKAKLTINSFRIDYLTKFVSMIEDDNTIDTWINALYNNVRNPLDSSNTILPLSMKKVRIAYVD